MKTLDQFLEELDSFYYEDLEDKYADMLDEVYGSVELAGMTIYASEMRDLDPTMFRCNVADYVNENYEEYKGVYYFKEDFERVLEEFKDYEAEELGDEG